MDLSGTQTPDLATVARRYRDSASELLAMAEMDMAYVLTPYGGYTAVSMRHNKLWKHAYFPSSRNARHSELYHYRLRLTTSQQRIEVNMYPVRIACPALCVSPLVSAEIARELKSLLEYTPVGHNDDDSADRLQGIVTKKV